MTNVNRLCDRASPAEACETDAGLLGRLRDGDQAAGAELYRRYATPLRPYASGPSLAGLAHRFDADDIVQSVFRTFLRGAQAGRYAVPEGAELWGLLLVITLNKVRAAGQHHLAARRDVRLTRPLDDSDGADATADPLREAVADDLLAGLLPTLRRIVELRLEGYSVDEIARATARSKRTVERCLQECRHKLLRMMGSYE